MKLADSWLSLLPLRSLLIRPCTLDSASIGNCSVHCPNKLHPCRDALNTSIAADTAISQIVKPAHFFSDNRSKPYLIGEWFVSLGVFEAWMPNQALKDESTAASRETRHLPSRQTIAVARK